MRALNSFTVYLYQRIVQELNALCAETMVSVSLSGLTPMVMQKGDLICEPSSLVVLPYPVNA